ncbi:MAG TPA: hypothetical protein VG986_10690 [Pseudolabrys sp.]|nr:hypothetical protein [Pseudolabrys sp.]
MKAIARSPLVFALIIAIGHTAARAAPPTHTVATVNGVKVDRYTWLDSQKRPRSVSLKMEGNGNTGHGGYAVQLTYQYNDNGTWRTVTANATSGSDGGFGYFVSHERYRDFTDGSNDTIANKVFHKDDSPLGRQFAAVGTMLSLNNANAAGHRFTTTYSHYGTIAPIRKDADGNDVSKTPTDPSKLKLYALPVSITWVFQTGMDYPRIQTTVDLSQTGGPDRVNFDLRAPYGVLNFDNGGNNVIKTAMWGDRYHFMNTAAPLTRNSTWTWRVANKGARYNALIAGAYEMGLVEPKKFSQSTLADGYSDARGHTSTSYNKGKGCRPDEDQLIPCDWEWPYQSAQYSLPYNDPNGTTTFEKIAWGTTAFWGTGTSLTTVYDTASTSEPFKGFPGNKRITYNICVVLGRTIAGGLTKSVAAGPSYNCATAAAP